MLRLFAAQTHRVPMKTVVHRPSPAALRRLARVLRDGGLVALPTETVYGLAAHALDARACRAIFRAKRRPADDPLIVHVADVAAGEALAVWNEVARALARRFWPGPLTLVLPRRAIVPDVVTSGQDSVALRSPSHPLARRMLRLAGVPLAAPSANPFGYVSPTTAEHVVQGLGGRIGHVLDGGPCAVGLESTIVDARDPRRLVVLRPGAVTPGDLRTALRTAGMGARVVLGRRERLLAPGLLDQHYSPRTPFRLVSRLPRAVPADTTVIRWSRPDGGRAVRGHFWLSRAGSVREAARRLYAVLRAADAAGRSRILCERAPRTAGPLALAINDRLRRAAGRRAAR
jgi:L-threonylcarbamoyladenylate synthase